MMDAVLHVAIFRHDKEYDDRKHEWEELPQSFEPGSSTKSREWLERCIFLAEEISQYQAFKDKVAAKKVVGRSLLNGYAAEKIYNSAAARERLIKHKERMKNLQGKA